MTSERLSVPRHRAPFGKPLSRHAYCRRYSSSEGAARWACWFNHLQHLARGPLRSRLTVYGELFLRLPKQAARALAIGDALSLADIDHVLAACCVQVLEGFAGEPDILDVAR